MSADQNPSKRPTWGDLIIASLFAFLAGYVACVFLSHPVR